MVCNGSIFNLWPITWLDRAVGVADPAAQDSAIYVVGATPFPEAVVEDGDSFLSSLVKSLLMILVEC